LSQLLLRFDDGSTPALETSAQRLIGKLTHLPGEQESRPLEIVSSNQAAATKVSSLQSLPQSCNQLNLYRNPKCPCHSGDSRKLHPKLFRYLTMRMARLIVSGLAVIRPESIPSAEVTSYKPTYDRLSCRSEPEKWERRSAWRSRSGNSGRA
jgi:hypothetical protein